MKFTSSTGNLVKIDNHFPHEHIENLSAIVFGFREGLNVMAFFTLFLDASGKSKKDSFLVMAGYVAPTEQWNRFVDEWMKVLQSEGVDIWHMKEFAARKNAFKGWDTERCERVYGELTKIIRSHISFGVVSAVEVGVYRKFVKKGIQRTFLGKRPYKFCLLNCMVQVKDWLEKNEIHERVTYVVERGDDGYKEARETYDEVYRNKKWRKEHQLGAFMVLGKDDPAAIPCQAADILAWECRQELIEQRKPTPMRSRLSLERLLLPSDRDVVWDKNTLPLLVASLPKEFSHSK